MPPCASCSDEVVLGACLPSISSLLLTLSELAWPEVKRLVRAPAANILLFNHSPCRRRLCALCA